MCHIVTVTSFSTDIVHAAYLAHWLVCVAGEQDVSEAPTIDGHVLFKCYHKKTPLELYLISHCSNCIKEGNYSFDDFPSIPIIRVLELFLLFF